jgi:hypothetical protein
MPPQQEERLLDLFDGPFGLGTHWSHLNQSREDIRAHCMRRNSLHFKDLTEPVTRLSAEFPDAATRQAPILVV